MVPLTEIVAAMQGWLRPEAFEDWPGAWNGLQVENGGAVRQIFAAVDAAEFCLEAAAREPGALLLVHHGLFWNGVTPITGAFRRKLQRALAADLAVYSMHLPLDAHPELGNNARLCQALGFTNLAPFLFRKGIATGFRFAADLARDELVAKLSTAVGGRVTVCPGGPERVRQVGVVTGGAGTNLALAASEGVDTFITGEGAHWTFAAAEELGINLLYAGHYATETFGVQALAARVAAQFGLPWEFIDHPSGL